MSKRTILVAGGAGFIGSHIAKMIANQGNSPVIFDNLSLGDERAVTCGTFIKGDLAKINDLKEIFQEFNFDAVIHFAGLIDVGESVVDPAKYYINNVACTLNLLETMREFQVDKLVFSSTAAIFGSPIKIPMDENHPCLPINPYGETKWMVEKILHSYAKSYQLKYCAFRYFNAAGGDPEGIIKNYKKKETNLIPLVLRHLIQQNRSILPGLVLEEAINGTPLLTIYGTDYETPDGTCLRDYIHIRDLGTAHLLAMEKLLTGEELESNAYNLGNGNGYSVREVITAAERVTGLKVKIVEGERRAGDPGILIADSSKAKKELGWEPEYGDLDSMILHAWRAFFK